MEGIGRGDEAARLLLIAKLRRASNTLYVSMTTPPIKTNDFRMLTDLYIVSYIVRYLKNGLSFLSRFDYIRLSKTTKIVICKRRERLISFQYAIFQRVFGVQPSETFFPRK